MRNFSNFQNSQNIQWGEKSRTVPKTRSGHSERYLDLGKKRTDSLTFYLTGCVVDHSHTFCGLTKKTSHCNIRAHFFIKYAEYKRH